MEYFDYLPGLRLLACRTCKTCVTKCRIQSHLTGVPHKETKDRIRQIQEWAGEYDIVGGIEEIKGIPVPNENDPPITSLGSPGTGGFRCEFESDCVFVGTQLRRVREHLRTQHGWVDEVKVGRKKAGQAAEEATRSPFRANVEYQRLFVRGPRSEYFEVSRGSGAAAREANSRHRETEAEQAFSQFEANAKRLHRAEQDGIDDLSDDFKIPNPWLRRLGSASHLRDFSGKKDFLRGLIRLDYEEDGGHDDRQLRLVHQSFERVVAGARRVTRPEVVSWNALFEVNRKERTKERDKPFHGQFGARTNQSYQDVWKRLLAYVIRTLSIEDAKQRPPFRVSRQQKEAYESVMKEADELDDVWIANNGVLPKSAVERAKQRLDPAVLDLCLSLLDDETKDAEYQNITVSFITVLSIQDDGTWESYMSFTPKLSGLIAVARLLVIKKAVSARRDSIESKVAQGMSREDAEEESPSHYELVSDMVRRFMVAGGEGSETMPMQFIYRLRSYGMAANADEAADGSVSWEKEQLTFKGLRFGVPQIQASLVTAWTAAEAILFRDLLFCPGYTKEGVRPHEVPDIPWDEVIDNAAERRIGYSMADAMAQHDSGKSRGFLFRRLYNNEQLSQHWYKSGIGEDKILSEKAAWKYGASIERFLELLFYCVHLSYGGPARVPEISSVRFRNTANGGVRNLFIDRGLVMIVTGYHKGYSKTQKVKVIHRFLPREIGTLMAYYIWLVLPFWEAVQANAWAVDSLPAEIWMTEPVEEEVDGYESDSEDAPAPTNPSPPPPSHNDSKKRRKLPGAGPHWTPARMSRIVVRESSRGCGQAINISAWRHAAVAFTRRYFRLMDSAHVHLLDELRDDDSASEGEDDSPWDAQTGHGSKMAGNIYGRLITEGAFETHERRVNFRVISEEWHRLFGFPSAADYTSTTKPGHKRKTASVHHEAMRELQVKRWRTLRQVDIDVELRRLYGEGIRFRGGQRRAVEAVMCNKSPIVVIMGTGGGKSLCFMLPAASCSGGVTVVIVPLVSLQGNMRDRCDKLGLSCTAWSSARAPRGSESVVFVTPESAMSKLFQSYLEGLRITAQLDRIVVDECHTILEGSLSFRPKIRELGLLSLIGVQMVYLTATLPPSQEAEFFQHIQARAEDVHLLRGQTVRSNVRYSVVAAEGEESIADQVRRLVSEKLGVYGWPAKVIVYCETVQATREISEHLGCDVYFREVDTQDGKAARLRAWMSNVRRDQYGDGRVIVATNALGLGIDVPDIRVVLHVGAPRRMSDYAQQSGRAGRDGEASEAVILQCAPVRSRREAADSGLDLSVFTMDDFVRGDRCRRQILDAVMDGRRRPSGCRGEEESCDVCDEARKEAQLAVDLEDEDETQMAVRIREKMTQLARCRREARIVTEQDELSRFRQILAQRAAEGCLVCHVRGQDGRDHTDLSCSVQREAAISLVAAETRALERFFQRGQGLESFGCCSACFCPQEFCNSWDEIGTGGLWRRREGEVCRYKGVVSHGVMYTMMGQQDEALELFQDLGFKAKDGSKYELWRWLGSRIKWAGTEAIMLCRVFSLVMSIVEE